MARSLLFNFSEQLCRCPTVHPEQNLTGANNHRYAPPHLGDPISHYARSQLTCRFVHRVSPLKEKLGPVRWQLPSNFRPDLPRLKRLLNRLPQNYSHALEFRHPEWFCDDVFSILRQHSETSVSMSLLRMPMNFLPGGARRPLGG